MKNRNHFVYDLGKLAGGDIKIYPCPADILSRPDKQRIVDELLLKPTNAKNLVVYSAADILAKILVGNTNYTVDTIYLEYENLPAPSSPITYPTLDRSRNTSYYLTLSTPRDYIRVPLFGAPAFNSSDPTKYTGNRVQIAGVSQGIVGENGIPYNDSVNSTVFGVALAASVDPSDRTKDVIYAASYTNEQGNPIYVPKGAGQEIFVAWTPRFL